MKLVTASMKQREAGSNRVVFQLAHWQVGVSARVLIKLNNHAPLAPIEPWLPITDWEESDCEWLLPQSVLTSHSLLSEADPHF